MKKIIFGLIVLCTIAQIAYSTSGDFNQTFSSTTATYGNEIVQNWNLMAVGALIISSILVALAYMIGNSFEIADLKAWASNEAVQIIANLLIIIVLAGFLVFLDTTLMWVVSSSNVGTICTIGESCLKNVSNAYLDQYIGGAKSGAESVLRDNVVAGEWANRRFGAQALTILALQYGISSTVVGNFMLDQDMHAITFEYYTNMLSSLEAQKFFVDRIAFGIGPIVLALGIVCRSFFFSRKLGGLLIAMAAGAMFFFPAMYVFDWITLDTTLNADKGFANDLPTLCPAECAQGPPIALLDNTSVGGGFVPLTTPSQVYALFSETDQQRAQRIINGTDNSAMATLGAGYIGKPVVSCEYGTGGECPTQCRELPYPSSIPMCNNRTQEIPQKCAALRAECKVVRQIDTSSPTFNLAQYNSCPSVCKITPPLRSNCNVGQCLNSRYDCRVTYREIGRASCRERV